MSNTRTPARGSFFEFGSFVAVAKPREKHRLPGLPTGGVALATKATLDNDKQCMANGEMYTRLLIMCSFLKSVLNYNLHLNSGLSSWRAPLLDLEVGSTPHELNAQMPGTTVSTVKGWVQRLPAKRLTS